MFPVSPSFKPLDFFLGLYLLWFTTKQKTGKILVSAGLIILTLFSCSVIANKLLRPLEKKYDSFEMKGSSSVSKIEDESAIKYVVVLGGGHTSDPELPLISQIGRNSLVRLMEGIRIYRKYPGVKLILSGGRVFDPVPEADTMARVAMEIGVPENDIILEPNQKIQKTRLNYQVCNWKRTICISNCRFPLCPGRMAMFKNLA
jgi:uncharacterized SAM-binding protein YcdF (DUF218 family)